MTALDEVTADQLEEIFHEVLKRGDAKGVEATLTMLAVKDPHRAQRLLDLTRAALVVVKSFTDQVERAVATGELDRDEGMSDETR